jgi:hypothetical protein
MAAPNEPRGILAFHHADKIVIYPWQHAIPTTLSELRTKTKNSCPESGQELSASAEAVSANSFTVFL